MSKIFNLNISSDQDFYKNNYLLEQIIQLIIDYRGKTPKKLKGKWSQSGIPALSAKNIQNNQIVNRDKIRFVDEELYSKWMKDEINKGDILLTSEGPLGESYLWDYDEKIVLSQRLFAIRINEEIVYPKYVYAFLNSRFYQNELNSRATGTTVLGIRQSELRKTLIKVPTKEEQLILGDFFYIINKKIELNYQMNETLEKIAYTIFKSWYIDFEPFQDGESIDSELGEIPKGWKVESLGNLLNFKNGKDINKKMKQKGNYAVFGSNGKIGYVEEWNFDKGIIIGRVGAYCGNIKMSLEKFWASDNTIVSWAKNKDDKLFYYYQLLEGLNLNRFSTGSAQPLLTQTTIKSIKFISPNKNILTKFNNLVEPFYIKINMNKKEITNLLILRNLLLPQLISGRLRIKNPKKFLEEIDNEDY